MLRKNRRNSFTTSTVNMNPTMVVEFDTADYVDFLKKHGVSYDGNSGILTIGAIKVLIFANKNITRHYILFD